MHKSDPFFARCYKYLTRVRRWWQKSVSCIFHSHSRFKLLSITLMLDSNLYADLYAERNLIYDSWWFMTSGDVTDVSEPVWGSTSATVVATAAVTAFLAFFLLFYFRNDISAEPYPLSSRGALPRPSGDSCSPGDQHVGGVSSWTPRTPWWYVPLLPLWFWVSSRLLAWEAFLNWARKS